MNKATYQEVVIYLQQLKTIYETVGGVKKEVQAIAKLIEAFQECPEQTMAPRSIEQIPKRTPKKTAAKSDFIKNAEALLAGRLEELQGTKIDYTKINSSGAVISFFDEHDQATIMKKTTVIDLKLLYCLLTGEIIEIKGTKAKLYDTIKRNIRARKNGKAFAEW